MIDVTPFVKTLNDKPVAVFGLGLSGLATVRALLSAGARVIAWDDNPDSCRAAAQAGADIRPLGPDVLGACACLVLSPGVPLHYPAPHEVVSAANLAGVEIIGDLEILHRCAHGRRTVAITGTNGKSTTTALVGHILEQAGRGVMVGGNIGRPVLAMELPAEDGVIVLEISSYQIDLCPSFKPEIAVLVNITPDHIDRHGTFDGYAAAKQRLFEGQGTAILSVDDEPCRKIHDRLIAFELGQRAVVPVSVERDLDFGIVVEGGQIFDKTGKYAAPQSLNGITTLTGVHNHQNAAMAYAVCHVLGLAPDDILAHMKTYPGLPHRQFTARTINGVAYVNDSKATNAVSAGRALSSYNSIYWICGGRPKEGGLNGLELFMSRVRRAYVIGEAMEAFSAWLTLHSVEHENCGTLQAALAQAHADAQAARGQPGGAGVVLLSPACASFDQFKSYEERGEVFEHLVSLLPGEQPV